MAGFFHFKQFSIDQAGCAMKVNTDGVLLAALLDIKNPAQILDIGTGTGLIALMLAQKFPASSIDAVEIDENAAVTAGRNFANSPFSDRIRIFHSAIEDYFFSRPEKYDLIVSNPPYFINSLRSEDPLKKIARHTDISFFDRLLIDSSKNLKDRGLLYIILPVSTSEKIKRSGISSNGLQIQEEILIQSFPDSKPHRTIQVYGFERVKPMLHHFVIYEKEGLYSSGYRNLLKDYLTIF